MGTGTSGLERGLILPLSSARRSGLEHARSKAPDHGGALFSEVLGEDGG
jgi:hypothetical protein